MESLEDAVKKAEAVKDTEQESEGLRPVRARIKKNVVDTIYSHRFTADEMKFLREAAEGRGIKLSELIREGAIDAAAKAQDVPSPREEALKEAREFVGAAAKALEKAAAS